MGAMARPRGEVLFFGRGILQFELRAVKTPANGSVIQGDGGKTDQRNLSRSFRTLTIQKSSIIRATQYVGKVQKSKGWLGNVLFRIATIIAVPALRRKPAALFVKATRYRKIALIAELVPSFCCHTRPDRTCTIGQHEPAS
jgi:hypothetical protein